MSPRKKSKRAAPTIEVGPAKKIKKDIDKPPHKKPTPKPSSPPKQQPKQHPKQSTAKTPPKRDKKSKLAKKEKPFKETVRTVPEPSPQAEQPEQLEQLEQPRPPRQGRIPREPHGRRKSARDLPPEYIEPPAPGGYLIDDERYFMLQDELQAQEEWKVNGEKEWKKHRNDMAVNKFITSLIIFVIVPIGIFTILFMFLEGLAGGGKVESSIASSFVIICLGLIVSIFAALCEYYPGGSEKRLAFGIFWKLTFIVWLMSLFNGTVFYVGLELFKIELDLWGLYQLVFIGVGIYMVYLIIEYMAYRKVEPPTDIRLEEYFSPGGTEEYLGDEIDERGYW